MKKFICGFLSGGLIIFILMLSIAYAEPIEKNISAVYNDIKIFIDGKLIVPKDVNENEVEPFIVDGTTYVPIRAVSSALGKNVNWDENEQSIYIGEMPDFAFKEVKVSNAEEFVNAVKPYTRIILEPGLYDFTNVPIKDSDYVYYEKDYVLSKLSIKSVYNLEIIGSDVGITEFITQEGSASVLRFKDCKNITIKNIKSSHNVIEEVGAAFLFISTSDVLMENCHMYCSSEGLYLLNSDNYRINNTTIEDCLSGIELSTCNNIVFENLNLIECHYALWTAQCLGILFDNCNFENNNAYGVLIDTAISNDKVTFKNTKFINNQAEYLDTFEGVVTYEDCTFSNNVFSKGQHRPLEIDY